MSETLRERLEALAIDLDESSQFSSRAAETVREAYRAATRAPQDDRPGTPLARLNWLDEWCREHIPGHEDRQLSSHAKDLPEQVLVREIGRLEQALHDLIAEGDDEAQELRAAFRIPADGRSLKEQLLAVAQTLTPTPQGWQPMETAPKDGTEVLVVVRDDARYYPGRRFISRHLGPPGDDLLGWALFPGIAADPSDFAGWAPLPDPPATLTIHPESEGTPEEHPLVRSLNSALAAVRDLTETGDPMAYHLTSKAIEEALRLFTEAQPSSFGHYDPLRCEGCGSLPVDGEHFNRWADDVYTCPKCSDSPPQQEGEP